MFQIAKGGSAIVQQLFHVQQQASSLRHHITSVQTFTVFINAGGAREEVNTLARHAETGATLEGYTVFIRRVEVVKSLQLPDFSVGQLSAQEVNDRILAIRKNVNEFVTVHSLDALRRCGESYIVRGNNDKDWAVDLPHSLTFTVEGVRFFLVHNKKDVPKDLSGVDVVVFGHSHKYEEREENGVLWLNPGSCGRRRFHQEITLCRMEAEAGHFRGEKCLIPHEGA